MLTIYNNFDIKFQRNITMFKQIINFNTFFIDLNKKNLIKIINRLL